MCCRVKLTSLWLFQLQVAAKCLAYESRARSPSAFELVRVLAWRHTDQALEAMGEMALAAEPGLVGDLSHRHPLCQELLRLADSYAFEVGMRGHSHFGTKDTQEVVRAQADIAGDFGQGDAPRKVSVNIVAGLPYHARLMPDRSLERAGISVVLDKLCQNPDEARLALERRGLFEQRPMQRADAA